MTERRGLGYKPDRRHLLGAPVRDAAPVLSSLPDPLPRASLASSIVEVLDQGQAPFCVSHAITQAVRICQVRNGVRSPRLGSRLWLMYLMHAIEHDVDQFDGAIIADGFEVLQRLGLPPESAWPYSDRPDGNFRVKPPQDVFRQAHDRIAPTDYGRILSVGDQRVEDARRAISAGYPVVFGTMVSEAFCSGELGPGGIVDAPNGEPVAGGHALCAVGYDSHPTWGWVFDVVNSWGTGWGNAGHFLMTANYLADSDTEDTWFANFEGLSP